ncbi:alpha/beta hydrolase fold domain-containing protein [Tsukamurella sp. 8F]|uniref:alpha/beta hydrolase fold domain-containing protein n=1 Tax=unclassified Tsukamurella TaxID=2633480 RepID=UPI0023B9FCC3|nr:MULTISPECIES: alpha/beta hydrolase fold domain-containing protein [unclassified Tsukamurella]MDF0531107.1 alpha/beta hydrolase fold domain-containing protein [Tsukamurella sp. 8J]MDF0588353.1 alpha/beta hydrolase fold domain-containing protein [Tsukamurella sp. 8F]
MGWAVDDTGAAVVDPVAAPGRASDLSGFPPSRIAAAQFDVFRDEDIDFARRLITAGIPTDLHVYAGAFHAWDRLAPDSTLAESYTRTWHTFLRRYLHA